MSKKAHSSEEFTYYVKDEFQERMRNAEVDVDNLSLGDLLASERTNLANKRNIYALKRTEQAAERTFAAWLRTGFSIVSAGVAFAGLLQQTADVSFANYVGSLLIIVGLLSFVNGWYGYFETYRWLRSIATPEQRDGVPTKRDLVIISIITFILLATSITAFAVIIL